jgi:hypothetical protein
VVRIVPRGPPEWERIDFDFVRAESNEQPWHTIGAADAFGGIDDDSVGRSGIQDEPARGEDLEPATVDDEMGDSFSMRQQSATAAHIRVQPYNAAALSDCRSVLEEVVTWGLVCYH